YGCDALWLDVGNENCRITSNLFLDGIDSREHVFIEASRDAENLLDNNIIWNVEGRYNRSAVPAEPGSSGWYKNSEAGMVRNGYGIYLEGTDRVRMVGNLVGKCNYAGFFAKTVAFRIMQKRGGTTRENKFFNNLFYQCGEAAVILPTAHQEMEGNAYARMPGGFLRVMYPEPEMCLDLPAWQEFCAFDLTGSLPDLEIEIHGEDLTMEVTVKGRLAEVLSDEKVCTDYFGDVCGKKRVPGPIDNLQDKKARFSIDPRKPA
ncbi:MAG TPA: right-handed parallel beta-helix repeat-containing protein, partial [Clostridia bacterium]